MRGATLGRDFDILEIGISIHAPRAGGDGVGGTKGGGTADFNPRPPCGGRPLSNGELVGVYEISIHAPRAGGDVKIRIFIRIFK